MTTSKGFMLIAEMLLQAYFTGMTIDERTVSPIFFIL